MPRKRDNINDMRNTVKHPKRKRASVFSFIEEKLKLDFAFEQGLPVRYLPYILFFTALGIFYIGNGHYGEKAIRKIDVLQVEVENLRADYTSMKAAYMFASKQSEVARKVEPFGLYESSTPPFKIIVEKGEY